MVTGDNESPNPVPDFLTGYIPSQTIRIQPNCDHNDSLDATLSAPEQDLLMVAQNTVQRLADVQNRPSSHQHSTHYPPSQFQYNDL